MIAALALLLAAQAAPAANVDPVDSGEDIVVTAEVGRVTLVFDRGTDGRLHNCRVMKSSGVDRIDAGACDDLPDCFEANGGGRFCDGVAVAKTATPPVLPGSDVRLDFSDFITPEPAIKPATGPFEAARDDDSGQRLEDLPPPPQDHTTEPAIRITNAQDQ